MAVRSQTPSKTVRKLTQSVNLLSQASKNHQAKHISKIFKHKFTEIFRQPPCRGQSEPLQLAFEDRHRPRLIQGETRRVHPWRCRWQPSRPSTDESQGIRREVSPNRGDRSQLEGKKQQQLVE